MPEQHLLMQHLAVLAQLENTWYSRVQELHRNYCAATGRYREAIQSVRDTHLIMSPEKTRMLKLAAQDEARAWQEYVSALQTFRELVATGQLPSES